MERVIGQLSSSWSVPALFQAPRKEEGVVSKVTGLFAPRAAGSDWSWEGVKAKAFQSIDLLPDICVILESANSLTREAYNHLPTWMRVAFASTAVLNVLVIPLLVRDICSLLGVMMPKIGRTVFLNHGMTVSYLATVVATLAAVVAMGVKEFCALTHITVASLDRFMGWIFPWVGYGLRLGGVLNLYDVMSHASFQYDLSRAGDDSKKIVEVLLANRAYLRRANGNPVGMKESMMSTQAKLSSWNPVSRVLAHRTTHQLSQKLKERAVCHLHNQLLGLGANVFALGGMIATNVMAVPMFYLFSSAHYLAQTVHRWNMIPKVSV